MNLFQRGDFILHSGQHSPFKIDCDALGDEDIDTIAMLLADRLPPFGSVEGVPRGGLRLAAAMAHYVTPYNKRQGVFGARNLLVVDDVYTTGESMEAYRNGRDVLGAVIFARTQPPEWVVPLFSFTL